VGERGEGKGVPKSLSVAGRSTSSIGVAMSERRIVALHRCLGRGQKSSRPERGDSPRKQSGKRLEAAERVSIDQQRQSLPCPTDGARREEPQIKASNAIGLPAGQDSSKRRGEFHHIESGVPKGEYRSQK